MPHGIYGTNQVKIKHCARKKDKFHLSNDFRFLSFAKQNDFAKPQNSVWTPINHLLRESLRRTVITL